MNILLNFFKAIHLFTIKKYYGINAVALINIISILFHEYVLRMFLIHIFYIKNETRMKVKFLNFKGFLKFFNKKSFVLISSKKITVHLFAACRSLKNIKGEFLTN